MPFSIVVRKNSIPNVQASIKDNAKKVVRDHAHSMRDYAKSIAPVDTGAFRASLYVNGPDHESDYAMRVGEALIHRPNAHIVAEADAALLDRTANRLRDSLGQFSVEEAIVAPAVEYGLFLEYGTVHMAPRPTLQNAALATRNQYIAAMAKIASAATW